MFSYQLWAAEDPACQAVCVPGGERAACAGSQPSNKTLSSHSLGDGEEQQQLWEQGGEGGRWEETPGREVGLAHVPHRRLWL